MSRGKGQAPFISLEIVNRSGRPSPRRWLAAFVVRMAVEAAKRIPARRFDGRELTIAFLGEREARVLNKLYRKRNYATDVLSFKGEGASLGELAICSVVISRQARQHGLLAREELAYMVVHGFLHLLGFDHERGEAAARRMFRIQDEIWESALADQAPVSTSKRPI